MPHTKLRPKIDRRTRLLQKFLKRWNYKAVPLTEEERRYAQVSYDSSKPLPAKAEDDLRSDHPRLDELRKRYQNYECAASVHTQWNSDWVKNSVDLRYFRGDNPYVFQYRQAGSSIELKTYTVLRHLYDKQPQAFESAVEDGLFGCWSFDFEGYPTVSRDLLDSINELGFLEEHLQVSQMPKLRILDIGAGYGRLAHRSFELLPNLANYTCVDAIAESTFLSEYYLRFRGTQEKTRVVPLDEFEGLLGKESFDIAVNIHSFSECTITAIRWWLERIVELRVPYLLIVPNDADQLLSTEARFQGEDFRPLIEAAGYTCTAQRSIYSDPNLARVLGNLDCFFLFYNPEFARTG